MKSISTMLAVAAAVSAANAWSADAYPDRPITLVVPFSAGSGTDILTRSVAVSLSRSLSVPVVVDNKPGANGAIGGQFAARSRPDGYTLLVGSATTNAVNFHFYAGKLGYDESSFVMAAGLSGGSLALYVPYASPWQNVAGVIASGKAGKLTCGSGNAVTQVACEILKSATGVDAVTAPYKSNPQSLNDVIGGQISYAFSDAAAAMPLANGKRLRAIAVAGPNRDPAAPQVPTFAEQGLPDIEFRAWTGVFAPANTPRDVVQKINTAVNAWLDSPSAAELLRQSGSEPNRLTLPQAAAFAHAEATRWGDYIRRTHVHPE